MKKLPIRKGSTVEVISGSQKGKKGAVLEVNTKKLLVRVQGAMVQTKNDKREGTQIKKEGYIHYSNLKLVEAPKKTAKKKSASK